MQPYRYLVRNKSERVFLINYLKETFPEFYKWLNEFKEDEFELSSENASFFCDYVEDDYDFSWCDNCSTCTNFDCVEGEKMKRFKVIEVNKLMRNLKLERICK